jgi:hypothetical protein
MKESILAAAPGLLDYQHVTLFSGNNTDGHTLPRSPARLDSALRAGIITASATALLLLASCDQPVSAPPSADNQQTPPPTVATDNLKQRQAEFLNRIRAADPDHRTIDHAMLNEQNELGLILDRTVEMDRVPDLMRSILTQMAREFPGQDLTVLAYTPSNPPHKIGTAQFNAQTRDIAYTPVP